MKCNYYWGNREWPYKNIKPRIIAEEYLEEGTDSNELIDYKLMCFNGNVKCSFVCTDRYSGDGLKVTFYDREWRRMPFMRKYPASDFDIPKPEKYDLMIELAEKLSYKIPFLRVDFYEVGDKVYFGEATFYPGSGYEKFEPEEWDYRLGNWIEINR